MMLRHNLRTDAQICGKSASQASLFVRHGRGVNRVYCTGIDQKCLVVSYFNITSSAQESCVAVRPNYIRKWNFTKQHFPVATVSAGAKIREDRHTDPNAIPSHSSLGARVTNRRDQQTHHWAKPPLARVGVSLHDDPLDLGDDAVVTRRQNGRRHLGYSCKLYTRLR